MNQANPYTSFASWKKYIYSENPVPVSQRAHLFSDDLELYTGNNAQLKSIQQNKIVPLNFLEGEDAYNILKTGIDIWGNIIQSKNASQQQAAMQAQQLQQQQKAAEQRAMWQKIGIAVAAIMLVVAGLAIFRR